MPPAPWRHGQRASLLMIPGGGETLGAAVLAQAPGTCPQLGGWWFHVGRAGRSIVLPATSSLEHLDLVAARPPRCKCHRR